jgi:late competence protein required for DNA uptake (superfamily II DNA/RNA helicase)
VTDHYHCPLGCESPQPFAAADGRMLCGRCAFVDDEETEVFPCTPETCPGEAVLNRVDGDPDMSV